MCRVTVAAAWMTGLCALALAGACAPDHAEPPAAPAVRERAPLSRGEEQRGRLCGRGNQDVVLDVFCGSARPTIGGLFDLRYALGLSGPVTTLEGFAMTGHSSALVARMVSAINPRIVFVRAETIDTELLAIAFTRGDEVVELVARDRATDEPNFYLVTFELDCNTAPEGCTPGDLLTEAIENGWKEVNVYGEEDLANTTLDCRSCHQPDGPGTPKMLRMQELDAPWSHWFFQLTDGGQALITDFLAAKGDEVFAGVRAKDVIDSNPGLLSSTLILGGSGTQPNVFVSAQIEREVKESAAARGGQQPEDNSVPGESATWNAIYERAKRGEAISVPYHDVKVTDPTKLARMTEAYTAYREGRIARSELPDIRDVYPDDPVLLARMGFATEPGLSGAELLVQACGQCHNSRLDQGLSRARFNAMNPTADQKTRAIARLLLPSDSPEAMPPSRFRALTAEARDELIEFLEQ
jgi:hypothetical protein